jgi:hypothetical protein
MQTPMTWKTWRIHFQMIVSQLIMDLGCTDRFWVTDHKQWQQYEALRPPTVLIRGASCEKLQYTCNGKQEKHNTKQKIEKANYNTPRTAVSRDTLEHTLNTQCPWRNWCLMRAGRLYVCLPVAATYQHVSTFVHVWCCNSANSDPPDTILRGVIMKKTIAHRFCYLEWTETANSWRKHENPMFRKNCPN